MASSSTSSTTGTGVGGSVIDVQSLVSQLVTAERTPFDKKIAAETSAVTTKISAIGALKSALSTFETALASLKSSDSTAARSVTTSKDAGFTATATSKAAPGSYTVEVTAVAQAHQISSQAYAGGSTQVVGTGTLTLSLGATSFAVNIDSSNSTLQGIRDAINSAPNNPGIQATLINSADGSHLVLTSAATGAANTIAVAPSGGDGGLAGLAYGPGNTANYRLLAGAQDASIKVAGYAVTGSTNKFANVIEGVTLNISAAAPGVQQTLTIANDSQTVSARIQTFVTAYNALETQIAKLRSYDAATRAAGPMLGDTLLTGLESQLRRTISDAVPGVSGSYQTLSSIGITTQADGTLAVDASKLQTALDSDFDAAGNIFSGTSGVATRLDSQIKSALATGGPVDTRSQSLIKQQAGITAEQDALNARMAKVQATYLKQFSALDTLLSSLQTTSAYLTQQIDNLPKPFLSR